MRKGNKMKGMKIVLIVLQIVLSLQLVGEELKDVLNEVEFVIMRTYKGEVAQELAKKELWEIVMNDLKTEKEKIDEIRTKIQRKAKRYILFMYKAEQGDANAQYNLGCYYFFGGDEAPAGEKNPVKAFEWFNKSAAQGNAEAQEMLGTCYENGIGVEKDMNKAIEWYSKSAEQGHRHSQYKLGAYYFMRYYKCIINKENALMNTFAVKAFTWLSKSAEQGHFGAQSMLARCYEGGIGVKKDLVKAFEWHSKAAEQGISDTPYYYLGQCYEYGKGVEKDMLKAIECYLKAATMGNEEAKKRLELMK